jgi:hypothetical protein
LKEDEGAQMLFEKVFGKNNSMCMCFISIPIMFNTW